MLESREMPEVPAKLKQGAGRSVAQVGVGGGAKRIQGRAATVGSGVEEDSRALHSADLGPNTATGTRADTDNLTLRRYAPL